MQDAVWKEPCASTNFMGGIPATKTKHQFKAAILLFQQREILFSKPSMFWV
jgi:hypothetical protein